MFEVIQVLYILDDFWELVLLSGSSFTQRSLIPHRCFDIRFQAFNIFKEKQGAIWDEVWWSPTSVINLELDNDRGTGINTMHKDRWIWICTNEGISFRQDDSWYDLILGTVRYKIIKDRMLNDREHKLGRACTNNDNAKNRIGEHPRVYFLTFLDDEKSLVENQCFITYSHCCCCRCCSFPISFFPHPSFPGKFWGGSSFFLNMKEGTDELSERTFTTCFEGYGYCHHFLGQTVNPPFSDTPISARIITISDLMSWWFMISDNWYTVYNIYIYI